MIQLRALTDYAQYFLDGAMEYHEIDNTTYLALRLYGDRDEVEAIVGDPQFGEAEARRPLRFRLMKCDRLAEATDRLLTELPPQTAGGLVVRGITELPYRIKELAEVLSNWCIVDETTGGDMEPFRKVVRLTRAGQPTPRVRRRLYAPGHISHYVRKREEHWSKLRGQFWRNQRRSLAVGTHNMVDTFAEIQAGFEAQRLAEMNRSYAKMTRKPLTEDQLEVLRRAVVTAASIVGYEAIRQFAAGKPLVLKGRDVHLAVERQGSMIKAGHGALSIKVTDPSGALMARLCLFFRDTPALDQVTAMALHVEAGIEDELIQAANLMETTDLGRTYPAIANRHKVKAEEQVEEIDRLINAPHFDSTSWQAVRNRCDAYFNETGPIWIERLTVAVCGARYAPAFLVPKVQLHAIAA